MSQLYLAADADILADRLFEEISANRMDTDPFEPIQIVVPNRFVEQWLKFRIARSRGVAINIRFSFLESALWDWLRELDPRAHEQPPEMLGEERYQLMTFSILWNDTSPALAALQADFGPASGSASRSGCRRVWQFAERFAGLFRDYEYHRQDAIVQPWLTIDGRVEVSPDWHEREAAQREIFRRIVNPESGRRALLSRATGRNLKTFPQYVMELHCEIQAPLQYRTPPRKRIHLFGLSQISPLHMRALELVGRFHDCRIYHFNPLASRLTPAPKLSNLRSLAGSHRTDDRVDGPVAALVRTWGRAAAESLDLTAEFLADRSFEAACLASPPKAATTTLSRLQVMLLGQGESAARLPQDSSLQIVACPGVWREAETIHAAIVHLLDKDPHLRQSDIAVLVSDMEAYRPALAAVFDRPPRLVSYGLADYSAARVSVYGQALIGMLDAALENLSRSRVFEILLNPCVLVRFGVDRDAALHWQTWAKNLGIFHGWDAAEKRSLGYRDSPLYSWKLGLQKLRLGRYMTVVAEDTNEPAPEWDGVIPFADVESGDRDRLDQFCRLVEGLLPTLVRLRSLRTTGAEWAETLTALTQRFLAIPADRPEEEAVRDALLESLRRFAEADASRVAAAMPVPLALVREFLAGRLREIPGRRNEALASGVTIAALKPQRPVPFDIIFLAGMGERHFPGGAAPNSYDLRQVKRQPGDILPIDAQRLSFLEAILAARQTLIITYNARDLQKDETLQPAIPVAQLQRCLSKTVTGDSFQTVEVPLTAHDIAYLDPASQPEWQNVLISERDAERVLALDAADSAGRLSLSPAQVKSLDELRVRFERHFPMPPDELEARAAPTVSLSKLAKFLRNPADAALRYHVRAASEWNDDQGDDFEPLTSAKYTGRRLVKQTLQSIVRRSADRPIQEIADEWRVEFSRKYREWTLRGHLPEAEFAEVDEAVLREDVATSLDAGLLDFLTGRDGASSCGPYLIGESDTPLGAKRHLPALELALPRPIESEPGGRCRVVGSWAFSWRDEKSLDLLAFVSDKFVQKSPVCPQLFEPLLFVVALAASDDLNGREVRLNVALAEKLLTYRLGGGLLLPDAAREYLSNLAADFLDVNCADQLPFAAISTKCRPIYDAPDGMACAGQLLSDLRACEEDSNWGWNDGPGVFTEMGFRVPDDAAEKLRRRLWPLAALFRGDAPSPGDAVKPLPSKAKRPASVGGKRGAK